ncbi:MAG: Crp/Fnr family transcriptional regulator [Acidisphaera sp.]|nr:Crp/Fnr family transcriptional regulator [Acidisphaera sp.]
MADRGASSSGALSRKLGHFAPLSVEDVQILDNLGTSDEHFEAHRDIVAEGEVPRSMFVLKEGMACRYRILPDGRRQIITFLIPGDLCDLHVFLLKAMDHSIAALTPVRLAAVSRDQLMDLAVSRPRVSAALRWSTMQEEAMLRERIVSLGRRDARGRLAYLLCELLWRYQAIDMVEDHTFRLPLTQLELADTLGLTPVHVNRVLQNLRRQGMLILEHRTMVLLDVDSLQEIAQFNSNYLHLGGAPEEVRRFFERLELERQHGRASTEAS